MTVSYTHLYGTPIYSTKETLEEIGNVKSLGDYPRELFRPICLSLIHIL